MRTNRFRLFVFVAALLLANPVQTQQVVGGQGDKASVPDLPYKLVDWPELPTTAAGVPGAWNFIQVASVAVTPRGSVLVLHRGAHPVMEFQSSGTIRPLLGRRNVQRGKGRGHSRSTLDRR